jgi:hypothetical protein
MSTNRKSFCAAGTYRQGDAARTKAGRGFEGDGPDGRGERTGGHATRRRILRNRS